MLTVASIFRDSADYIDRYFNQVAGLGEGVRVVLAEGDSNDNTYERLLKRIRLRANKRDVLLKIDHGGVRYGSVDHPQRWDDIALVVRGVLEHIDPFDEPVIWVESDLIWDPTTLLQLVDDLIDKPAVAPMVLHPQGDSFYDVWGYRKDGVPFDRTPPYHAGLDGTVVKIDSCGSCFALAPGAYPSLHAWSGHWPFTAGGNLWLDTTLTVRHP